MQYSVMGKQQGPQVLHKLLNKKISLSFAVIFKVFSFSPLSSMEKKPTTADSLLQKQKVF